MILFPFSFHAFTLYLCPQLIKKPWFLHLFVLTTAVKYVVCLDYLPYNNVIVTKCNRSPATRLPLTYAWVTCISYSCSTFQTNNGEAKDLITAHVYKLLVTILTWTMCFWECWRYGLRISEVRGRAKLVFKCCMKKQRHKSSEIYRTTV